jgi:hypothetical protein
LDGLYRDFPYKTWFTRKYNREISYDKETGIGKNHFTLTGFVEKLWASLGITKRARRLITCHSRREKVTVLSEKTASRPRSGKLRNRRTSISDFVN